MEDQEKFRGSFTDEWKLHKDDLLWRKFWALWEIRRKWNWTNWFYQKLDRTNEEVVAPKCWSLFGGENFMKLCLWISLLRSLHEGLTENLDSFDIPSKEKIHPSELFKDLPESIKNFPLIKENSFRDFRNAVFHCQWSPTLSKFMLDEEITKQLEELHKSIGFWVNEEFRNCYKEFGKYYESPPCWIYSSDGTESMPELFF